MKGNIKNLYNVKIDVGKGKVEKIRSKRDYVGLKKRIDTDIIKEKVKFGEYLQYELRDFLDALKANGSYSRYAGRNIMLSQCEEKLYGLTFLQKKVNDKWYVLVIPSKKYLESLDNK